MRAIDKELVLRACKSASKILAVTAPFTEADKVLTECLEIRGFPKGSKVAKETLDHLFKGLEGLELAWKIHNVAQNFEIADRRVGRQPDPELKALAATLPRLPGYVAFVNDRKHLAANQRIMKEQGVVVYTCPNKSRDMRFPLFCAFQSLKSHRNMEGLAPRWFVPAGKGLALLRVFPTEYREMPRDSFSEAENIKDEVLKKDFYKHCDPNPTYVPETADPRKVAESNNFPFEVGDWVYVDQTYLDNDGKPVTFTVKAQIERTRNTDDPTYCDLRLEPGVHKTPTLCLDIRPNRITSHEKKLITQRAFPPIPYSSKREIGTSDVPGGYLNLDWE